MFSALIFDSVKTILTSAIAFIWVTNDAKSPKVPLRVFRYSVGVLIEVLGRRHAPVVRFWERCLLVAKKPPMAVGGVDNVEVAPDQWTRRRRDGDRDCYPRVVVYMPVGAVGAGRDGRKRPKESKDEAKREHRWGRKKRRQAIRRRGGAIL